MNAEDRVCARPGCTVSMADRRPQARFCSGACRAEASRMARSAGASSVEAHKNRTAGVSVENSETTRRVSTPGMGVRSYFASTEQADVVARELRLAAMQTVSLATADLLTDAAERIARASDRQRLKLQTSLELAA